jgi:hypothetical protein
VTQVLVTKPGTLDATDKRMLRKAGVVTVEAAKPEDVRLLSVEGPAMGGGDLLFAAMTALARNPEHAVRYAQDDFVKTIVKLMAEARP